MNITDENYSYSYISYVPAPRVNIFLDKHVRYLERSAYTFFMLVGDLGGFAGAVMLMPTWFMAWYSSKVF